MRVKIHRKNDDWNAQYSQYLSSILRMRRLALSRSAALNFPAKFGPNATRGLESATHGIHLQPTPPESSPPRTRRQPDTSVFFPACRCRIQSPTPPRAQLEITPHRTPWTPPIHPPPPSPLGSPPLVAPRRRAFSCTVSVIGVLYI